jgi:pimeloyl-ACP methyl ester carboxylesterase
MSELTLPKGVVLSPDYRGAGGSTKPQWDYTSFTKFKMAEDFHLLIEKLGLNRLPVHILGHDIGCTIFDF